MSLPSGRWIHFVNPLFVVGLSLLCASVFLFSVGHDPSVALNAMWKGALGSSAALKATALKTAPLILTGLAVTLAFRAGVWNIGAEGQLYMGALVATAVATLPLAAPLGELPSIVIWPLVALCGALGGAALASIAAWLRYKRGVSEVISTILLNFVAIQVVAWSVLGPLGETGSIFPQSRLLPEATRLPAIDRLHIGIIFAVVLAVLGQRFLLDTPAGFRWRSVGADPQSSRYTGIAPEFVGVSALLVAGSIAGLAGAFEVMGVTGRLYSGLSPGIGYTAIAVALLARLQPLSVIWAAVFFGIIETGSYGMQRNAGVSAQVAEVIQGLVVLVSALTAPALLRRTRK
jgi:simple sugar transport system permease protein